MNFRWTVVGMLAASLPGHLMAHQATPPADDSACTTANLLREVGLYEDATERYLALLDANPRLGCAQVGLISIANGSAQSEAHLRSARELEAQGDTDRAREAYRAALDADHNSIEASKWLEDNPAAVETTPESTPFAASRALNDEGFESEAQAQLVKELTDSPSTPVPDDLQHLTKDQPVRGQRLLDVRDRFTSWWGTWHWLLIPIVALVVLPFLVFGRSPKQIIHDLRRKERMFRRDIHVDIVKFDKGAIAEDLGSTLETLVELEYRRVETFPSSPRVVSGSPAAISVDTAVDFLPSSLSVFGKLLKLLPTLGQRNMKLNAVLLQDRLHGPGILVSLHEGDQIVEQETIWTSEVVDPSFEESGSREPQTDITHQYVDLAMPVAVWLHYQLAKSSHKRGS
jgi:tetratricopeptide (TPR) repeat protein